jgi:hypothetical protein
MTKQEELSGKGCINILSESDWIDFNMSITFLTLEQEINT